MSTEAGTRGQVRASLWGYGFIGMFRDEGPGALGYRHCGREVADVYSTEESWVLQGWMLSATMNARDMGRGCLGRKAWIAGEQGADRMRRGD